MKVVKVAKSAGFCFGVEKAVGKVYQEIEDLDGEELYTYGPIIHNEYVTKDLENKGVRILHTLEDSKKSPPGTVIIRSHGVGEETYRGLEKEGYHIKDATCPFVLKIHRIVQEHSRQGREIIIIGNPIHPEVKGIIGWSCQPCYCINSIEEAEEFNEDISKTFCIVAQTTFNKNKFQHIVEILEKKGYDIIVSNTVCNATRTRQEEARSLARQMDTMIVIGGENSSNTQKLFEICKSECQNTYYIQSVEDLDLVSLRDKDSVGITAGASTPKKLIEEVQQECQNLVLNKC